MVDYSGIPKPFALTDGMRAEEEDRRMAERRDGSRKAAATTVGSGGRLDVVGGDFTVTQGGNAAVRDGGRFLVEGGGSMDITDDGVIRVNGQGYEPEGGNVYKVTAEVTSMDKAGYINYRSPGIRFTSDIYGADEASIYSREGGDIWMEAGTGRFKIATNTAYFGTSSPDYAYDYRFAAGDGGGVRSTDFTNGIEWGVKLYNSDQISGQGQLLTGGEFIGGHDGLFLQGAGKWSRLRTRYGGKVWLESKGTGTASVEMPGDGRVLIKGATDVTGTFTVNGQPVGGGTWDSITGKPSTFPPSAHTHSIANVTNLQATLDGKAGSTHGHNNATSTTPGFMSPTDKGKLDGATAGLTTNTVMYRDAWGRAQIADPVGADDIANKRAVDKKADASYTASTQATIGAGFSHYNSSGWTGIRYTEKNGFVEVTGAFAKGSWGPGEIIARLPQSMWPPAKKAGIKCEIGTTGEISTIVSGTGADSIGAMYIR